MIRLALPKGRNLRVALEGFRAAGLDLGRPESAGRRLRIELPELGVEVLMLKDWDLPLYVENGVADCGVVGSDVLAEVDGDLLTPVRFLHGRCRMSLIGRSPELPEAGSQVRLATKYPETARKLVSERSWGAEILRLSGSIELAAVLGLAETVLDIVQSGQTLRANSLSELETVAEVAPCLVVNRLAFQLHRTQINDWLSRLEAAGVVE